jgi:hypothetical protein
LQIATAIKLRLCSSNLLQLLAKAVGTLQLNLDITVENLLAISTENFGSGMSAYFLLKNSSPLLLQKNNLNHKAVFHLKASQYFQV